MRAASLRIVLALALLPVLAFADAPRDRFSAGGYFRIMTRPDLQGGNSRLGFWNLYGRLLNEGPYAMLELKLDVLQAQPGTNDVWASVHAKIEGSSVQNADPGGGGLTNFRVSQLYVKAGNIGLQHVTWQLGTLENYFGDLGLYDVRPATLFNDTIGLSARYQVDRFDLLLGIGDSGYAVRSPHYDTIFTGGGSLRLRVNEHFELGGGGQVGYEPEVQGNRFAPYYTPAVRYEDFLRKEVAKTFFEQNPGKVDQFPKPVAQATSSFKAIGYLGFGKLGPLRWNNFFLSYKRLHPDNSYTESYLGRDYTIYLSQLTDERYQLQAGNEMQLRLIPDRLDAVWGVLYGQDTNLDNKLSPTDENRRYYSTVLRLQLYVTPTVHLLAEGSVAEEKSLNGNLYRNHVDSLFQNTGGLSDARGFENGDAAVRDTSQFKGGLVLNPTGFGIYARPSLRLLYGLQYSTQQAAFGNGFVDSLDQFNVFIGPERHWHSLVAIEAEAWF